MQFFYKDCLSLSSEYKLSLAAICISLQLHILLLGYLKITQHILLTQENYKAMCRIIFAFQSSNRTSDLQIFVTLFPKLFSKVIALKYLKISSIIKTKNCIVRYVKEQIDKLYLLKC